MVHDETDDIAGRKAEDSKMSMTGRAGVGRPISQPNGLVRGPATGLTVERVAPDHWERIEDWDEAVGRADRPNVFLTRDWVVAWWRTFGMGREPWLLRVATSEGSTIGLAPFYLERVGRSALQLPVRRLGLMGDRGVGKIVGSEYLGLVARAGREPDVGRAVLDHLATQGVAWDAADLLGLLDGDPAGAVLENGLRPRAGRVRIKHYPCSMIPLPADFDTYLAGLSYKFRQNYRNQTNKLVRNCNVRFFMTSSEAELRPHLERLFVMHQAHWTSSGYSGTFYDPRMRQFYLDISSRLLRSGCLRFWHLEVDGVIRASQFGFAYDGIVHALQEGYDIGFRQNGVSGLGVVLRGHVLHSAIDEGLRGYDFMLGVENFKTRWATAVHHVRDVRMAAPGLRGRLAWLALAGADDAQSMIVELAPDRLLRTLRLARARRNGDDLTIPIDVT